MPDVPAADHPDGAALERRDPAEIREVEDFGADPRGARAWTVAGAVFAVLALVVAPFLTGPIGMALATVGHVKQDPWGIRVAVFAGVAMVASMALQALVFGSGGVAA